MSQSSRAAQRQIQPRQLIALLETLENRDHIAPGATDATGNPAGMPAGSASAAATGGSSSSTTGASTGTNVAAAGGEAIVTSSASNVGVAIPLPVVEYFLNKAGCHTSDPTVLKMASLAIHRLLHTIIKDTQSYYAFRTNDPTGGSCLLMEDMSMALKDLGIDVSAATSYYVDDDRI